ncbi:MAG: hypothetical protein EGQ45_07055, partial [Clostridiales bacterium]|nr:hypothetical protein [Clostridiales bacterium]
MIERLRKRFIRIATLAVAGVLLLLCVTVNTANYISADRQLTQMLQMICDNQGTVPHFTPDGGKPGKKPDGPFTPETPYSTRYFVLRYDGDGDLEQADLTHIAAVSENDTAQYLTAALRHGAGFGYTAGYKYYVVHTDTDRWMAVFLDCYQELRAVRTLPAQPRQAASGSAFRSPKASASPPSFVFSLISYHSTLRVQWQQEKPGPDTSGARRFFAGEVRFSSPIHRRSAGG